MRHQTQRRRVDVDSLDLSSAVALAARRAAPRLWRLFAMKRGRAWSTRSRGWAENRAWGLKIRGVWTRRREAPGE